MSIAFSRGGILAGALMLCLLGGVYQAKGNYDLIWGDDRTSAVDLLNRDVENRFFARGENPFDHVEASQPPWGYPVGLVLTWPEWPQVRPYFAAINGAAFAFLLCWVYHASRRAALEVRLLMMASVLAFGGCCTGTEIGQINVIVTALLAGALWCDERDHPYWCGILVALSLIKPTISAPFAIALLVTGRYRAAVAAAAYGAAASAFSWWVTGADPIHMLQQMQAAAARYVGEGTFGVMDLLAIIGVSSSAQVALTPLIVAAPAALMMVLVRQSLPTAFAVAAVWGRLWTYHKSYDDVMLVFVLVPIGVAAFSERSRSLLLLFIMIGVLAWAPARVLAIEPFQVVQLIVWPFVLLALVSRWRRGDVAYQATPPIDVIAT